MSMNGIDIASYQAGIDLSVVSCDFVIIKATQGTSYVNPDFSRAYNQAVNCGKLVGIYHYSSGGGAVAEATHFLNTVGSRLYNAVLVLDWESGDNPNFNNVAYAKQFLDHVYSKTGVRPIIYMSKSVCNQFNWSSVAVNHGLWVAQYANYNRTGYQSSPWTDNSGYGAWSSPVIFQYSSSGLLSGWNGNLDLNVAYMDATAWNKYAGKTTGTNTEEDDEQVKWDEFEKSEEYKLLKQLVANSKATEPNAGMKEDFEKAKEAGITTGERPLDSAKREEVAVMVYRALGKE